MENVFALLEKKVKFRDKVTGKFNRVGIVKKVGTHGADILTNSGVMQTNIPFEDVRTVNQSDKLQQII